MTRFAPLPVGDWLSDMKSSLQAQQQAQLTAAQAQQAAAQKQQAAASAAAAFSTQKTQAYTTALKNLYASWSLLPTAPYPPSGDTTNFPRTGTQSLFVSASGVSAAQLAEPGKITKNLQDQANARRPKLNAFFVIGALCLGGYFLTR